MFGSGDTRLQPVYVEDVGEASARVLQVPDPHRVYELADPRVYSYRTLLRALTGAAGNSPLLMPTPFALWRAIGYIAEFLPSPPITRSQVALMEGDNIAEPDAPGFDALQISPRTIEDILPEMLHSVGAG